MPIERVKEIAVERLEKNRRLFNRPAHDGARDAFQDFRLAAENFVVDYVDDPPPGAACNAFA
jgi:hypothetical protein